MPAEEGEDEGADESTPKSDEVCKAEGEFCLGDFDNNDCCDGNCILGSGPTIGGMRTCTSSTPKSDEVCKAEGEFCRGDFDNNDCCDGNCIPGSGPTIGGMGTCTSST